MMNHFMKRMKYQAVALLLLVSLTLNLVMATPVLADPIAKKSLEYAPLTQELTNLLTAQADPEAAGYSATDLQQKIATLQFQKYLMETSEDWGVCRNDTTKTIGVYANKPGKLLPATNTLFYLAPGDETDDEWDCDGVYLPSGTTVDSAMLEAPSAYKILDGTRFVISADSQTEAIRFNLPLAQAFKADEIDWTIPDLTSEQVSAQVPNAPVD